MNKIVREHYPASKLPEELRTGLPSDASVKVTVEEELPEGRTSRAEFAKQLEAVRRNLDRKVSVEEAVARIRELRDEWDY